MIVIIDERAWRDLDDIAAWIGEVHGARSRRHGLSPNIPLSPTIFSTAELNSAIFNRTLSTKCCVLEMKIALYPGKCPGLPDISTQKAITR
jgi:hypothetical protein